MLKSLVKLSNRLDALGLTKEADLLDSIIVRFALDKALKNKNCEYPKANNIQEQDILDALDHISDFIDRKLSIDNFSISDVQFVSIGDLADYDDLSSWVEFQSGELRRATEEERNHEILSFRNEDFLKRALVWIDSCMINPIIIIQTNEFSCIADGRGRTNIAIGMGWKKVPVIFLREHGYEG